MKLNMPSSSVIYYLNCLKYYSSLNILVVTEVQAIQVTIMNSFRSNI